VERDGLDVQLSLLYMYVVLNTVFIRMNQGVFECCFYTLLFITIMGTHPGKRIPD